MRGARAACLVWGTTLDCLIGRQGFHDEKGELHFVKKAGFIVVEGDTNGDNRADFRIQVDDASVLRPAISFYRDTWLSVRFWHKTETL
jgi:hypothetical protein